MYKSKKSKSYPFIAFLYWILYILGLALMGVVYNNGLLYYTTIYYALFALAIVIVLITSKNPHDIGINPTTIKSNTILALIVMAIVFGISLIISAQPLRRLIILSLYFIFHTALVEEVIFRGFVQSYLFGLKLPTSVLFIIGGIMFGFAHLPFEMFFYGTFYAGYFIDNILKFLVPFIVHIALCVISYESGDITLAIAVHYSIDYLSECMK